MKKTDDKTNAIRLLEGKGIAFKTHNYVESGAISGMDVAKALQQDPNRVYKTLVTVGKSKGYYVFLVPVSQELNLKKAAKSVGEKSIAMIKSGELLQLTGYVHGGCSPIGMKKPFETTIDAGAEAYPTIIFSGGKIGHQIEISLEELRKVIAFRLAELTEERKQ